MQALKSIDQQFPNLYDDMTGTISAPVTLASGAAVTRVIELHCQGHEFNLEVSDVPFNALMEIRTQLRAYGMSHAMADAMIEQIEEMFVHEAVDFTRKKKPTPLKVRMMVTDRVPDIDHDNKTIKMIVFDGIQKFSGAGGGMGMANTINGTTTTEFDSPNFDEIFTAGRKHVLVIYLEKDANSKLNGMNAAVLGAALVEAAGPSVSAEALEDIVQAIEAGEIEPAIAELIESIADLKVLQALAEEPNAPADSAAKIEILKTEIAEAVSGIKELPPALAGAVIDSIDGANFQEVIIGSSNKPVLETIIPNNDNQIADLQAAGQKGEEASFDGLAEMAADVAIEMSSAEKITMLEVVEAADIPETLREKMIGAIDAGEFTVDNFKVVTARVENAGMNPAVLEMAQKVEVTAKEFVAQMNASIPPVALPELLANLILNTIQDLGDMPDPQKTELVQTVKEGPLPIAAAMQVIAALTPVKPILAQAIERHQISQAVTLQAIKLAANIPSSTQTNRSVAAIAQIMRGGDVPTRQQSDIAKPALPQPQRKTLEILHALQDKKITTIAQGRDIKSEMKSVLDVLKKGDPKFSSLAKPTLQDFLNKNPNPSPKDVKQWIETLPKGTLRNSVVEAIDQHERSMPKVVAFKSDPASIEKGVALMGEAMRGADKNTIALIEKVRDQLVSGQPVSREDFEAMHKVLPQVIQDKMAATDGPFEYKKQDSIAKTICDNCPHGGDCTKCETAHSLASGHEADLENIEIGVKMPTPLGMSSPQTPRYTMG